MLTEGVKKMEKTYVIVAPAGTWTTCMIFGCNLVQSGYYLSVKNIKLID